MMIFRKTLSCGICAVSAVSAIAAAESEPFVWGCRTAHPAVVNSVFGADPDNVISLRGKWEFQVREEFGRNQPWSGYKWMETPDPWPNQVSVPGTWGAEGIGGAGMSRCWDLVADSSSKPIRGCYNGPVAYRKTVKIPSAWRGRRIWLKVGGVNSAGWFFIDTKPVACAYNFCDTCKYEITDLVTPGKESRFVVQVRNDMPSRKGLVNNVHRWGGICRDVELEATPECFIDDAWVRGDFDGRCAEVKAKVEGEVEQRNRNLVLRATVEGEKKETIVHCSPSSSSFALKVPLRNFRPWSPEHPNLYTAKVELVENGQVVHSRLERFGVRKLEVRGKEFFLNGRPYFFRGFGDDSVYPTSGLSPADVSSHRRRLSVARTAGFNFVRLHTHCEMPEYFEAADEFGVIVEVELPYYNDAPSDCQTFDPKGDVTELWRNFRRHPSFCVYSMGNEGTFGKELDRRLHQYVKQMDPDRLAINQDSNVDWINPPESSDYCGGPLETWARGSLDPDRPFVNHEYMNLGAKLDSRLEPRFTGAWMPPVTRADRLKWLEKSGLGHDWGDRFQDASHALQRIYQKKGIECARTDPFCDGYCFWTIVDVVVANCGTYSAQGMFNPFWEAKSCGATPADIAVFNSPRGVFADFNPPDRILTSGQSFGVDVRLANYGETPMKDARLRWSIVADGAELAAGTVSVGDQALGAVRKVASLPLTAPAVKRPVAATFRLALSDRLAQVCNSWPCWLFPVRAKRDGSRVAVADEFRPQLEKRYDGLLPAARAADAAVVIAPYGSPLADAALSRGQRVVTVSGADGKPNVSLGWWWLGAQIGTVFSRHPALGDLPHDGFLSELMFRLVKPGCRLPVHGLSPKDLIVAGEGGLACYLYLAQAKCGKGRLLMSFGLDVLSDTPEGVVLLDGMIDYAQSEAFAPIGELAPGTKCVCEGK